MKIPLNWLKEYVDIDISTDELVKRLTAVGHMQDKKPEHVGDDVVLDLEVRQNRPDCLSVLGVAREVAAVTGKTVKEPSVLPSALSTQHSALTITNTAPDLFRRFRAVRIKLGTQNSKCETPPWMLHRLSAYGIKTISPLVDITNYVMVEYGEPMHAFDAREIKDGGIIIRRAKKDERLTVLGGRELTLTTNDLVIADAEKILSFSGLIGGEKSGVQDDTSDVVLEAATYNHAVIRRSSIRHQVRTEASTRHEKFLHPHLAEVALDRATQLVLEICGGEIIATADAYSEQSKGITIDLRLSEIERLGGVHISLDQAQKYLEFLGFKILSTQNSALRICVPYWRTDIEQEADLVEEVLRLYGYENIPSSLPSFPPPKDITSYWFKLEEKIRDVMVQLRFDEQITEPLAKQNSNFQFTNSKRTQVILQNALNADKNALRTSLQEGLTHAINHQKKFGRDVVRVFELGKVYGKTSDSKSPYMEKRHLGFEIYDGTIGSEELYFIAKGIVEKLCSVLSYASTSSAAEIIVVDEHTIFCEISIEDVWYKEALKVPQGKLLHTSVPNIQKFDISISVKKDISVGEIIHALKESCPEIQDVSLGENPKILDGNMKSVLFHFILGEDAEKKASTIESVSKTLTHKYSAKIR